MKKIVAISVLLVSLTAAVFAQDGWTFGLSATHVSDLVWASKMTGKSETTPAGGGATQTTEFGKYTKGVFNFFNQALNGSVNSTPNGTPSPDNRLLFSVKNAGENHEVYADLRMDGWETFKNDGGLRAFFFENGVCEDWYVKGNAGPFNAQIGSQSYGGWVSNNGTWNGFYGWNTTSRFGVWTPNMYGDHNFFAGNEFRTWKEWGDIVAVGVGFGDYKVSLGHRLNPEWSFSNPAAATDPADSASSANASILLSGRPIDMITFDVFYSLYGLDTYTFAYQDTTGGAVPNGKWQNLLGAYVGVNAIENLGLSIGYTANFDVYEKGGYYTNAADQTAGDETKLKGRTYTAPFYSGIDIKLSYSGIDKIGLKFNNNISFAGVKGTEFKTLESAKATVGLAGNVIDKDVSHNWFRWETELQATFALIENVSLTLHLGDRLGVMSSENKSTAGVTVNKKRTDNEFRVSATAQYGIGAFSVGTGLFFSVNSVANLDETTGTGATKTTSNVDTVSFGIPIMFKVSF
jgi:hypothetical protein